jgi:Uma2 family endonuclease
LRRPDLMVFCSEPVLTREALTVVPEAVIEVMSPGSEYKDLQIGPPSYLLNGVRDVIVVDSETSQATWFRPDGSRVLRRGEVVSLECGCEVTL